MQSESHTFWEISTKLQTMGASTFSYNLAEGFWAKVVTSDPRGGVTRTLSSYAYGYTFTVFDHIIYIISTIITTGIIFSPGDSTIGIWTYVQQWTAMIMIVFMTANLVRLIMECG